MKVRTVNLVMTLDLCQSVDLEELQEQLQSRGIHCVYDEWEFPGLRWFDEKFTALVFRTGKINVLNAKSSDVMETFRAIFGLYPKVVKITEVIEVDLERQLELEKLAISERGVYDPSVSPSTTLFFKGKQVLVFASGKVIVPGIKSKQLKQEVIEWLRTIVQKYGV